MGQAVWSLLCGRTLTEHGPGYVKCTVWTHFDRAWARLCEVYCVAHFDRAWARLCGVYCVAHFDRAWARLCGVYCVDAL